MRGNITQLLIGVALCVAVYEIRAEDLFEDLLLRKVIQAYSIQPFYPVKMNMGPKALLGQALFFDPIISGPKNIACATCHIRSKGAGDGIPLAVGLGGHGQGVERLEKRDAFIVPRNTLPLFNRGSLEFSSFFWDGRLQLGPNQRYESPLGENLPKGFDSLLAVASVLPLVEPDEMLGHSQQRAKRQAQHGDLVTVEGVDNNYQERALNAFQNIVARVSGTNRTLPEHISDKYLDLIKSAYPALYQEDIDITHFGNALASYIQIAFELQPAPWDRYVSGEEDALSVEQKRGAIIFYGKGRCAICHSGANFSDFLFHGLAIPQLRIGKHSPYLDYGRAVATSRAQDRFTFRTPPLRNVSETGPWGHNGAFTTLSTMIEHHSNPVPTLYKAQTDDQQQGSHAGRLLANRSPLLAEISPLSDLDIIELVSFLQALSSPTVLRYEIAVPLSVPSGNNEFISCEIPSQCQLGH